VIIFVVGGVLVFGLFLTHFFWLLHQFRYNPRSHSKAKRS
jgi:hypothetical protein